MRIIHVIPIVRGIGKETLSYFSASDIPDGSIVRVPVRSREILGLVIGSEDVTDVKSSLRNSTFAIRKVANLAVLTPFRKNFIIACQDTAEYFAGSTGSVLLQLTPQAILESAEKVNVISTELKEPEHLSRPEKSANTYVIQADQEERLAHYKSIIREEFARKSSVFFCLPTIQDTKKILEILTKGIEDYTFILTSALSKKEIVSTWNKILKEPHPVLIIGTGSFMGIPRMDVGTIIVERESAQGYKLQTRPHLDIRKFMEIMAKTIGARLIFGDLLLRIETLSKAKSGEYIDLAPLKFRSLSTSNDVLIDMKKYKTLDTPEFRIMSNELEAVIKRTKENSENLFIYSSRRGLSPQTVCGDCGTTVLCSRCNAPIVLHHSEEGPFFLCHRCGERRSAEERCKACDSWRLTTLGIGIELIEDSLKGLFPDITIHRMDKDTVKTHKQALEAAQKFYSSPGSILLGTEMALLYLERPIENTSIASIDSLFSIPDFRINEKIMNTILRIRSLAQKTFIIQTRNADEKIFDYAMKGNLMDFYRDEITVRRQLEYPPFKTLIKITFRGEKNKAMSEMAKIEELFKDYSVLIFPAFIETIKNKFIMHALIKVDPKQWVSEPLKEKLLSLSPQFDINVDPETLL